MFYEARAENAPFRAAPQRSAARKKPLARPRVYSLRDCPPLPPCRFDLVRRASDGRGRVMMSGCAENAAPTLNLALIRQRGAELGANEVHVWTGAPSLD